MCRAFGVMEGGAPSPPLMRCGGADTSVSASLRRDEEVRFPFVWFDSFSGGRCSVAASDENEFS